MHAYEWRAKIECLTKMTSWSLQKVQFRTDLLVKTVWPNSFAKLVKNRIKVQSKAAWIGIKVAQLHWFSVQGCAENWLFLRLFFVPSWALVSITDCRKAPKLSTIAHQYLVSKTMLGIFEILSPSHYFVMPFLQKTHLILLRWLRTVLGWTKCANFLVKTYCLWHKQLENEIILGDHRAPFFRKWVRTFLFSTFLSMEWMGKRWLACL